MCAQDENSTEAKQRNSNEIDEVNAGHTCRTMVNITNKAGTKENTIEFHERTRDQSSCNKQEIKASGKTDLNTHKMGEVVTRNIQRGGGAKSTYWVIVDHVFPKVAK